MSGKEKLAGVAILISDDIDFNVKKHYKRKEEGYHKTIKKSIQQEEIMITNAYAQNTKEPSYMKQILMSLNG